MIKSTGFLVLIAVLIPCLGFSASFDCKKAKSFAEKSICSDAELSALDEALSLEFKETMSRSLKPDVVKKAQLDWVKNSRDKCKDIDCMKASYRKRIADLSQTEKESGNFNIAGRYKFIEGDSKGYMIVEPAGKYYIIKFETTYIPRQQGCMFEARTDDFDENGNPTYGESDEGMKFSIKFKKGLAEVKEIPSDAGRPGCGMTGYFEGKYVKID